MLLSHNGKSPLIAPDAYVAPTATICGDVTIGPGSRILFGACLIAEAGSIELGSDCIVLENAVVRSTVRWSARIGNRCLVGPHAHLVGCTLKDEVFVATGASIFHGAVLGERSEVRVNGVVHLRTELPADATVPISWVAVGVPAQLFPPEEHEKIWAVQKPLNFPLTAYGIDRSEATMAKIAARMSGWLGSHRGDRLLDDVPFRNGEMDG